MKKIHLCLLFTLAVLTASSQKVYFIYIQTESEQPFFVKIKDKLRSSTASGYIILPNLVDSTYSFSIGFPQNKWPEQNFAVTIDKKDHGYLLKDFGAKGWGLFDLQTLAVQMAITGKAGINDGIKGETGEVSAFTEILSKAAGDPSLREKPVPIKVEEKKTEVAVQEIKKEEPVVIEETKTAGTEPVVIQTEDAAIPVAKKDLPVVVEEAKVEVKNVAITKPVEIPEQPAEKKEEVAVQAEETKTIIPESYKPSQVKKWSESSTTEGFGLVFIDDDEKGTRDTIRLIIPNPKPVVAINKEEPADEKKFIAINELPKKEEAAADKVEEKSPGEKSITIATAGKSGCNEVAAETDFLKLRKKMAAVDSDEGMISEAKKYYKLKCFTTVQVKNLGALFLTDEGKYKFFDASYKYVADAEIFNSLQAELKDEYYTSRFKAMLRN